MDNRLANLVNPQPEEEGYRFFRVEYDVEATAKKIRAIKDLDPVLADRLAKGL